MAIAGGELLSVVRLAVRAEVDLVEAAAVVDDLRRTEAITVTRQWSRRWHRGPLYTYDPIADRGRPRSALNGHPPDERAGDDAASVRAA